MQLRLAEGPRLRWFSGLLLIDAGVAPRIALSSALAGSGFITPAAHFRQFETDIQLNLIALVLGRLKLRLHAAPAATAAPVTPTTPPNATRSRSRSIGRARDR